MNETWKDPTLNFWLRMARAPITQMPPPGTISEDRSRKSGQTRARFSGYLPLFAAHLKTRKCNRCPTDVPSFGFLNDDEVLCPRCGDDEKRRNTREEKLIDGEHFQKRMHLTGLLPQGRVVEALKLTAEDPEPEIEAPANHYLIACMTARRYMRAAMRGLLILSGVSGTGKSTAAAWLAWMTHGLFLSRSEWTKIQVRSKDTQRLNWVITHGGVVVLDDACVVRPGGVAGDSDWESEVVFQISQARHEAKLGTIITSQATRDELENAYGTRGEALARRADQGLDLSGAPDGGGWVDCGAGIEVVR